MKSVLTCLGASKAVSRFATPFRSRCNSAMSSAVNISGNHLPSPASSRHKFDFDEEDNLQSPEVSLSHLSVPHSPGSSSQSRSPRLRSQHIESILQEVSILSNDDKKRKS